MILLYHTGGHLGVGGTPPCGGPALGVRRRHPLRDGDFPADNVRKLDGTTPQRGEFVICGTCGRPINLTWLSYRPAATIRRFREACAVTPVATR